MVKHIHHVSRELPTAANEFQYIVCQVSRAMADLLESKNGTSPVLDWINQKCDLPTDET